MAIEPSVSLESGSGRASPVIRKLRDRLGADDTQNKDKAFRRYASSVERSLSLFETALQEWADYISFLSRLLKSLQSHPPACTQVPSKALVAKRLAQCLNPSLPSGVHQKTLEVYNFIFSMIGKDILSKDLSLYLPGLSSTLSFASLSVRTPFLELIEKYILVIDPRSIRPALKSILLALLPGLEEDTSEEFERTLHLIDCLKIVLRPDSEELEHGHSSGDWFFWQGFFLASITSKNRRVGALAYLTRNLPKLGWIPLREPPGTQKNEVQSKELAKKFNLLSNIVISPEPGLLIRCFAAGLADEQLLTQRGFLDLLVSHLPLHSPVLQKEVKDEDLELLVTAAARIVSRREMNLNRRLWCWLLGSQQSSHEQDGVMDSPSSTGGEPQQAQSSSTHYFEKYGLHPLTNSLLKLIASESTSSVERARPFRICLSLMDKWEIGGLLIPDIFLPIIDSARRYKNQASSKADFAEVLRSASVFFDGVQSSLIWGEIIGLIDLAIGVGKLSALERIEKLALIKFIITHFNVREEEMLIVHAPLTVLTILTMLDSEENKNVQPQDLDISEDVMNLALDLCTELVDLIPERVFQIKSSFLSSPSHEQKNLRNLAPSNTVQIIKNFYSQEQDNLDASPPYSSNEITKLIMTNACAITCRTFSESTPVDDSGIRVQLLVSLLSKVPRFYDLNISDLFSAMAEKLAAPVQLPFLAFTSITSLATILYTSSYITQKNLSELVEPFVRRAWYFMSASNPKYHVETVQSLWQLQAALSLSNREIEAAICTLMVETDLKREYIAQELSPSRSFGVLWTHTLHDIPAHTDRRSSKISRLEHKDDPRFSGVDYFEVMLSRPLFLLLDALADEGAHLFMSVRIWIQNLTGIDKLFYIFVTKLAGFDFLKWRPDDLFDKAESPIIENLIYKSKDDLEQCLYYFKTLSNVMRWSSENIWSILAMKQTPFKIDKIWPRVEMEGETSLLEFIMYACLNAIRGTYDKENPKLWNQVNRFHRASLNVLHQILICPYALSLVNLQLENCLIERLMQSLDEPDPYIQVLLLDVIYAVLKLRNTVRSTPQSSISISDAKHTNSMPLNTQKTHQLQITPENADSSLSPQSFPAKNLVKCLQAGFTASSSRIVLDSWVGFLAKCLPLYADGIFQILIPLVETLCSQIVDTFSSLQKIFRKDVFDIKDTYAPDSTLISLINGLEHVLERGHDRLLQDELNIPHVKSPDQPQGFFGNMVSGVFTSETSQSRSATANHRLTILLIFQDAVKICFMIWSWKEDDLPDQDLDSASSFNFISLRMRNRARRLLEHMFAVEAPECLETMVEIWRKPNESFNKNQSLAVFNLLHVLDGSRPKLTIPAILNAIYSRTNPLALETNRKSTLTSSLNDSDLIVFLVEYAKTLEDDAMDEIWEDCMAFLKDLLSNPFPHRQTLPSLLEFAAILGEKVDNTNFGEQRKMRRELGDVFLRLLTAVFTTRPIGFLEGGLENDERSGSLLSRPSRADDIVAILADIAPNLTKILVEPDRVLNATVTISNSVIAPTFKSKSFPDSVSKNTLELMNKIAKLPHNQKQWKKDLGDAFNDPRFFSSPVSLVNTDWLPLMKLWTLNDKDKMPELLSRLVPPTTAGIVFGVGASSTRYETDRKAQLNLRRTSILFLAAMEDNFVKDIPFIQEKIVELLSATSTTSPSSLTRADIYILIRAISLKTSAVHLATLWPIINAELHSAISSVVASENTTLSLTYKNYSIFQACKLLDTLICIAPDDFQLHEWLYITDTIDAVYKPLDFEPVALIDEISDELGSAVNPEFTPPKLAANQPENTKVRRPLLGTGRTVDAACWERKDDLVKNVLRPFFSQLSIYAFEATYSMSLPDWETCRAELLEDIFDDRSIARTL
ncbi:unnamed protein product [Blumeria hordei]|uniref:Uncharacterized protein n=1 Tax=Blumeria hordei TaxID=2867405 RepID=A0A383UUA7_BLUHO|nr:unnamed protein product [Blumeria hordei]